MSVFNSKSILKLSGGDTYTIYRTRALDEANEADTGKLPFSIIILLENLLRKCDQTSGSLVTKADIQKLAGWQPVQNGQEGEVPYFPSRVVMQDFTGVPAIVDLAAMRDAAHLHGLDAKKINPVIPVDLVIDHSIQLDFYGNEQALEKNLARDYSRNGERYSLFKWGQKAFDNLRVFPPGKGIVHQINLEYISKVIASNKFNGEIVAFPDTLIGTDSHTTMIDGLGILGWGVGGIEAEAVMLGQPLYIKVPEVIGVKLTGVLPAGTTATDMVLTVTQRLRKESVVEKYVEFFGPGVKKLSVPDRATIANMCPEYGATVGFFPIDEKVVDYLKMTDREYLAELVDAYSKEQGLFHTGTENKTYTRVIEIDLSQVEPSIAGPSRPQDRISLYNSKKSFSDSLRNQFKKTRTDTANITIEGENFKLEDGSIVIAAITSCTNTSNPAVLMGAGLMAKKAVEKGLKVKKYVKTSFAPGSRTVDAYIKAAGLYSYLQELGFNIIAHGCTTCIGNSGPIAENIEKAIEESNLVAAAVLSGNRNFEARIHQKIKANYLASPLLVVAFALAGKININLETEPLGYDTDQKPVFLRDIWPSNQEIIEMVSEHVTCEVFASKYKDILEGDHYWQNLEVKEGVRYSWQSESTYLKQAPFFEGFSLSDQRPVDIKDARALLVLGDTVTTDHVSPAGVIPEHYPAGKYLLENGVKPENFNSYGSRRGNHEVMMRGTFANIRIKNKLVYPDKEGGYSAGLPGAEVGFIYDVSMSYGKQGIPLLVFGGFEYGTGSSRDWAAKGTQLLGIKAVIARSFERIHRSNLIGMGVMPLQFNQGENLDSLGLSGREKFSIFGISTISPGKLLTVQAVDDHGKKTEFTVASRLDTPIEVEYFKSKGILPYVLKRIIQENS